MIMKGLRAIACATESTAPGARMVAGDLVIGAGFAARNGAGELIDALVEGVNAAHVERDFGKIGVAAAQHSCDAFDGDFGIQRRALLVGFRIEAEQPAPGIDLARFGKLHADDAIVAPCDAASADRGVKNRVPIPRHDATQPRGDHNTVINRRIWNLYFRLRTGLAVPVPAAGRAERGRSPPICRHGRA